jgi:hypothetical protein
MGEMTREELSAMNDPELLAYERERHGGPAGSVGGVGCSSSTPWAPWFCGYAAGLRVHTAVSHCVAPRKSVGSGRLAATAPLS